MSATWLIVRGGFSLAGFFYTLAICAFITAAVDDTATMWLLVPYLTVGGAVARVVWQKIGPTP